MEVKYWLKLVSTASLKRGLENITDANRRELLDALLKLLKEVFDESLVSVVIFGSVARGTAKPSSDTDVLIVARDMPKSMSERMDAMAKLLIKLRETEPYRKLREKGVSTWVQFHPLNVEEAKLYRPIYLDMVEDGVIL